MKTKRYFFPGIITAGLLVLGLLADCGSAAIRARSIFVESADVVAGIGRAERECRQLMAALASARAAAMHADVPQLYSDLHFHMALVDDALVQVESMSAMAISSGWSRLVQQDRLAPQDVERTGPALERREARDALRSAVHALAASCARLISAARSFKALEAQAITVLDEDFSPHGLESIKPLLTTLLADEPLVLRALAELATCATELRIAITGRDYGRTQPAHRIGTSCASASPSNPAAPRGAS